MKQDGGERPRIYLIELRRETAAIKGAGLVLLPKIIIKIELIIFKNLP